MKGLLFFGVFVTLCNCFLCIYFTCAFWIEFGDLGIVYKKEATFTGLRIKFKKMFDHPDVTICSLQDVKLELLLIQTHESCYYLWK